MSEESQDWGRSMKPSKDEIFWKILRCALSLDSKKGYLRWTIAELSRQCRIPRPTIYYYFGKSKKDILLSAVKILGEECFGLTQRRLELWQDGQGLSSVRESRKFLQDHPELTSFYFSQRHKSHEIGEAIRSLEKKYLEKFSRFFDDASSSQADRIAAFCFGMVFTPGLRNEAFDSNLPSPDIFIQKLSKS